VLTLFSKHWQLLLSKHETEQGRREGSGIIDEIKTPPTTPPLSVQMFHISSSISSLSLETGNASCHVFAPGKQPDLRFEFHQLISQFL